MKTTILRVLTLVAIIATFGLKASSPLLPDSTAVEITEITGDFYAIQVRFTGYVLPNYDNECDWSNDVLSPSSDETFAGFHQFVHDPTYGIYVAFGVYVKDNANSSWRNIGVVHSNNTSATRYISGNFLYFINIPWSAIAFVEEPIEG
jgi:hypothetical protein